MTALFRGPITGPKFFAIISSFFIVIITVNVFLAVSAVKTFPGLEVKNSYVASQTFDADKAAQLALGWTVGAVVHADGELVLSITDIGGNPVEVQSVTGIGGNPVEVQSVTGIFGRATNVRDDQTPEFVFDGSVYRAPVTTAAGNWNLRLKAVAQDGTPFQQRIVVIVEH